MSKPWGDEEKIAVTYQFTQELISSMPEIEAKLGTSVSELALNELGRRRLFNEVSERAVNHEVNGYSPVKEMSYILSEFLEAVLKTNEKIALFYSDGLFKNL